MRNTRHNALPQQRGDHISRPSHLQGPACQCLAWVPFTGTGIICLHSSWVHLLRINLCSSSVSVGLWADRSQERSNDSNLHQVHVLGVAPRKIGIIVITTQPGSGACSVNQLVVIGHTFPMVFLHMSTLACSVFGRPYFSAHSWFRGIGRPKLTPF